MFTIKHAGGFYDDGDDNLTKVLAIKQAGGFDDDDDVISYDDDDKGVEILDLMMMMLFLAKGVGRED